WRNKTYTKPAPAEPDERGFTRPPLSLNLFTHVPARYEIFLGHDRILDDHIPLNGIDFGALQGFAGGCHRHVRSGFTSSRITDRNLLDSDSDGDTRVVGRPFFAK